jgi:hypothetical protein
VLYTGCWSEEATSRDGGGVGLRGNIASKQWGMHKKMPPEQMNALNVLIQNYLATLLIFSENVEDDTL